MFTFYDKTENINAIKSERKTCKSMRMKWWSRRVYNTLYLRQIRPRYGAYGLHERLSPSTTWSSPNGSSTPICSVGEPNLCLYSLQWKDSQWKCRKINHILKWMKDAIYIGKLVTLRIVTRVKRHICSRKDASVHSEQVPLKRYNSKSFQFPFTHKINIIIKIFFPTTINNLSTNRSQKS